MQISNSNPPAGPAASISSCCLVQSKENGRLPRLTHTPTELNCSSIYSSRLMRGAEAFTDAHAALAGVIFSISDKVTWMIPAK